MSECTQRSTVFGWPYGFIFLWRRQCSVQYMHVTALQQRYPNELYYLRNIQALMFLSFPLTKSLFSFSKSTTVASALNQNVCHNDWVTNKDTFNAKVSTESSFGRSPTENIESCHGHKCTRCIVWQIHIFKPLPTFSCQKRTCLLWE